jgi:DNA-binding beta-propeller fold protein YncE
VTAQTPGSTGQVIDIDPRTDVVLATIPVGRDPGALAAGDADVWVTNNADHTVARIDRRAMATIATIPVAH